MVLHTIEVLANNAGNKLPIGVTKFGSINALINATRAYGVHEIPKPASKQN